MVTYSALLASIVPIFLIIGLGTVLKQLKIVTNEAEHSLTRLVVKVLYPALILSIVLNNPAASELGNLLYAPGIGLLSVVIGTLLALGCSRFTGLRTRSERGTFAFTTSIFNYGYIPIPICALLFDRETMAILLIFNIGVEVGTWTVGVLTLTGQWNRQSWRRLLNPPIIALLIAIPSNLSGFSSVLPDPVLTILDNLGVCAIPLGLLMIGSFLLDYLKLGNWLSQWRASLIAIVLRLGIIPAAMLLLGLHLPVSNEIRNVLAVQAAMPCGIFMIVMSRIYGGHPIIALKIVLATTLPAIFLIPFVIQLGLRLYSVY